MEKEEKVEQPEVLKEPSSLKEEVTSNACNCGCHDAKEKCTCHDEKGDCNCHDSKESCSCHDGKGGCKGHKNKLMTLIVFIIVIAISLVGGIWLGAKVFEVESGIKDNNKVEENNKETEDNEEEKTNVDVDSKKDLNKLLFTKKNVDANDVYKIMTIYNIDPKAEYGDDSSLYYEGEYKFDNEYKAYMSLLYTNKSEQVDCAKLYGVSKEAEASLKTEGGYQYTPMGGDVAAVCNYPNEDGENEYLVTTKKYEDINKTTKQLFGKNVNLVNTDIKRSFLNGFEGIDYIPSKNIYVSNLSCNCGGATATIYTSFINNFVQKDNNLVVTVSFFKFVENVSADGDYDKSYYMIGTEKVKITDESIDKKLNDYMKNNSNKGKTLKFNFIYEDDHYILTGFNK